MRHLTAVLAVLILAACASKTEAGDWTHPKKPDDAFRQDRRECMAEANDAAGPYSDAWEVVEDYFEGCMKDRGWEEVDDA